MENSLLKKIADGDKIFFKPFYGQGGNGIIVLKVHGDNIYHKGKVVPNGQISRLLNQRKSYVIQKGIKQREDINLISSTSVDTLRCVTQLIGEEAKLCVCVMRIGRNGSEVDNSSQGGLSVQVDTEKGYLYKYATVELTGEVYDKHPDSGFVFENFMIEGWSHIKQQILDYARSIPEAKELSWDVAITKEGIEVIEINFGYGLTHLQCCCGGLRRVLNVFPH
jgi:hypothetical protein